MRFRYTTDTNTLEEGFYVDDIYPVASWSSVSTLTSSIATEPRMFPRTAVRGWVSPLMPKMNSTDATR